MKSSFTSLVFFCFSISSSPAQNFVINPGLENYIICPGFGQFDSTYISNWTKPSWGSTDYYHYNCPGIQPTSQVPLSGEAYFGIIAYNFGTEYREYATGELSSPLAAGVQFEVKFYVSLNDGYIQAVNELGAYFSSSPPGPYANSLHIPIIPQVQNSSGILGDTTLWMLVSGTFTAVGGEQYITIGNFNDDSSTTVTQVGSTGSYGAYYFVDDVSVVAMPVGIAAYEAEQFSIYQNPSPGIFRIKMKEAGKIFTSYKIYDYSGKHILSEKNENHPDDFIDIDLTAYSKGIYFFRLYSETELITCKLVKI